MKKLLNVFLLILVVTSLSCVRLRTHVEQAPPAEALPPEITIEEILDCQAACDQACLEWSDLNGNKPTTLELKCGLEDRIDASCGCFTELPLEENQ